MNTKDNVFTFVGRDVFRTKLLVQEFSYWRDHPEEFTQDSFDFICQRRGFNESEMQQLRDALAWAELEYK